MVDNLAPEQRRRCMASVRQKGTKPELELRRILWAKGLRYRLNRRLPGKPDLVFVGPRVVVFVDGCFWHACPVHGTIPATNSEFWKKKISGNVDRDRRVSEELRADGWVVVRVWEHEVKNDLVRVARRILRLVKARMR